MSNVDGLAQYRCPHELAMQVFQTPSRGERYVEPGSPIFFAQGQIKLEIHGLPSSIDPNSVRITGLGNVQLLGIACTVGKVQPLPTGAAEAIRSLQSKRALLHEEKKIIDASLVALNNYVTDMKGDKISPKEADSFLDTYMTRARALIKTGTGLDEHILLMKREIRALTLEQSAKQGRAEGLVTVIVMAQAATDVELKLTYVVRNATWSPTYELLAESESGKPASAVSLHYRARITQSTGEDWTSVALTLSTVAMDGSDQRIPDLKPIRICPPTVMPLHALGGLFGRSSGALNDNYEDLEPGTIVNASPLSMSYRVEGKSSISSDGVTHNVSFAQLQFEAEVAHIDVPRVKAIVYLQAGVKNTSNYWLLPGPVNVFLDDGFVSQTSIQDIAPGDTFDCTLGPDSSTKITYARQSKLVVASASAFSEPFKMMTYTAHTIVYNRHAFALERLIVRDVIPVSVEEDRVRVILRCPEILAEANEGEDCVVAQSDGGVGVDGLKVRWRKVQGDKGGKNEGMFEWVGAVGAGKEIMIETEWDVRAPADVNWVETS
ncbi:hypothetical protein HETIRDRAFT_430490 [Heterobasidion irregulare TC 32-1]|uniref:Mucoidy inhibitor A n=1 Tax=Heterobasidion irregulare (strain TC 32-1) TaxID=747525 RepID=W4JSL3_HETIT|nr:uncharacterized protein HETIRDRAFT_430490 [Heterobasidion irregulare TC 32-1]ETW76100.1 hypothetical protein HETIRDRAFT_430490 [Heterobasidion irregulare TC 32-1]